MTHTPNIELVYDLDCPNVEGARALLRRTLSSAGLPLRWTEWDRNAGTTPTTFHRFGSPTILVDGVDIADDGVCCDDAHDANSCRVYPDENGAMKGVPPSNLLLRALGRVRRGSGSQPLTNRERI